MLLVLLPVYKSVDSIKALPVHTGAEIARKASYTVQVFHARAVNTLFLYQDELRQYLALASCAVLLFLMFTSISYPEVYCMPKGPTGDAASAVSVSSSEATSSSGSDQQTSATLIAAPSPTKPVLVGDRFWPEDVANALFSPAELAEIAKDYAEAYAEACAEAEAQMQAQAAGGAGVEDLKDMLSRVSEWTTNNPGASPQ